MERIHGGQLLARALRREGIDTIPKMFYPDRLVATDLGRRPYHAMVEALGGYGELVTSPDGLIPALESAPATKSLG